MSSECAGSIDRPCLDRGRITALLADVGWTRPDPVVLETTTSTNSEVALLVQSGALEGVCVVAEEQTAGRGRQGRVWVSPPSAGLWMSVLVRPGEVPRSRWGWLSLLAGLAARDAITELGRVPVGLKWPNDLMTTGSWPGMRKLGGILSEACGSPDSPSGEAVVIGIGINVTLTPGELPTPQSTSLFVEGGSVDREALLVAILRHFFARLEQWRAADPVLAGDYRAACVTLGRIVDVSMPGGRLERGEAKSIDDDGHLEIFSQGKLVSVTAGDVIHATI
ncbi:MAG: biotin--[acetyl-CoA-carboxylase] ligase [Actinobacteria bacterium]|nr:biotin--[acetyl-CoA-carboxylase] ligase [Actinomycetota bacterium]